MIVPPISLTAQSGKDKKKKELFFYFHPISFETKRDGVDGREKSRGDPGPPTVFPVCVTLAVPEKRVGCFALILAFFDRGAKPCSLHPPLAALAGLAANRFSKQGQPRPE